MPLVDEIVYAVPDLVQAKRAAGLAVELVDVDALLGERIGLDLVGDVLHQLALRDREVSELVVGPPARAGAVLGRVRVGVRVGLDVAGRALTIQLRWSKRLERGG